MWGPDPTLNATPFVPEVLPLRSNSPRPRKKVGLGDMTSLSLSSLSLSLRFDNRALPVRKYAGWIPRSHVMGSFLQCHRK